MPAQYMMNDEDDFPGSEAWTDVDGLVMGMLALNVEPMSERLIASILRATGICLSNGQMISPGDVNHSLNRLFEISHVEEVGAADVVYVCPEDLVWDAVRFVIDRDCLERIADMLLSRSEQSYKQMVGKIRIALLSGRPFKEISVWEQHAKALARFQTTAGLPPLIDAVGTVLQPDLVDRFDLSYQYHYLRYLVSSVLEFRQDPMVLFSACRGVLEQIRQADVYFTFRYEVAIALLLMNRIKAAEEIVSKPVDGFGLAIRASIAFMQGQYAQSLSIFDEARLSIEKARPGTAMRLPGLPRYLYVLAQLVAGDATRRNSVAPYVETTMTQFGRADGPVNDALCVLCRADANTMPSEQMLVLNDRKDALAHLLISLVRFWLDVALDEEFEAQATQMLAKSESLGLDWISYQFSNLLARVKVDGRNAETDTMSMVALSGASDATFWIPQKPAWKRQISRLISMAKPIKEESSSRLVWLIDVGPTGSLYLEAREQKLSAKREWSKGKVIGWKRLKIESNQLDFLTAQDQKVIEAIAVIPEYGNTRYEMHEPKAYAALVGHPLVFFYDNSRVRVDLVGMAPTIRVLEMNGQYSVELEPAISERAADVVVRPETMTRYQVYIVTEDHRRIASAIGRGLKVPADAKDDVLEAIRAISSFVTVQSDIGGVAAGVSECEADARIHVQLLPLGLGLRLQLLVRPIPDNGPYCRPGEGGECVLAEVDGTPVQARRQLLEESNRAAGLLSRCRALDGVEAVHGEWHLEDPRDCLETLLQLQNEPEGSLIIEWPEGVKFKVGLPIGQSAFNMQIKGERDWFAANGELQIDEERVIDLTALLKAIRSGSGRFVSLGGNEFIALTEEFHRRLSDLAAYGEIDKSGVRVHPLASFALDDLAAAAEEAEALVADETWRNHIARLRSLDQYYVAVPSTLYAELRDYQLAGFKWLAQLAHWGVGACLADDMGLGKTVQSLALLLLRAPGGPALIVAPTSVCLNWLSETARFAPTLNIVQFGEGDRKRALASLGAFDVLVTTYGLLGQESDLFAGVAWHTIVLDEAQAIKNASTARSQAVMRLQGAFKVAVTGTPLENNIGELWNLFRFINPGLLGSRESFTEKFASRIEREPDPSVVAESKHRLNRLIKPFILRRTKTAVLTELPSRTEITIPVELNDDERALYESLRRSAVEAIASAEGGPGQAAIKALAELMKLRRVCCNPNLVAPEFNLKSSKLEAFAQLIDDLLENKHKVLVFSQFVDHLTLIRRVLDARKVAYQYLDGATPMKERKRRVDAFQAGEGDLFLISLKAGGVGINLTAADYVIHMDPWWNPAVEDQASDRAHRMGQTRPVTIYRLVTQHTIEEAIVDLHRQKRDLADSLLAGSDVSASMSVAEIIGILDRKWDT